VAIELACVYESVCAQPAMAPQPPALAAAADVRSRAREVWRPCLSTTH
jgi:hypothetical protein